MASKPVARLSIQISAGVATLRKDMQQAGHQVKGFQGVVGRLRQTMRGLAPVMQQLGLGFGRLGAALALGPIGLVIVALGAAFIAAKKFVDVVQHGLDLVREMGKTGKLGLGMTANDVKQVQLMDESLQRMRDSINHFAAVLAVQMAPLIAAVADLIADILGDFSSWNMVLSDLVKNMKVLTALAYSLREALRGNLVSPVGIFDNLFGSGWADRVEKFAAQGGRVAGIPAVTRDTTAGFSAEEAARRARLGAASSIPAQQLAEQKKTNEILDDMRRKGANAGGAFNFNPGQMAPANI